MVRSGGFKDVSDWIPTSLVHDGRHLVLIKQQRSKSPNRQPPENDDRDDPNEVIVYEGINNAWYDAW